MPPEWVSCIMFDAWQINLCCLLLSLGLFFLVRFGRTVGTLPYCEESIDEGQDIRRRPRVVCDPAFSHVCLPVLCMIWISIVWLPHNMIGLTSNWLLDHFSLIFLDCFDNDKLSSIYNTIVS
jgi:hypothetical protein